MTKTQIWGTRVPLSYGNNPQSRNDPNASFPRYRAREQTDLPLRATTTTMIIPTCPNHCCLKIEEIPRAVHVGKATPVEAGARAVPLKSQSWSRARASRETLGPPPRGVDALMNNGMLPQHRKTLSRLILGNLLLQDLRRTRRTRLCGSGQMSRIWITFSMMFVLPLIVPAKRAKRC